MDDEKAEKTKLKITEQQVRSEISTDLNRLMEVFEFVLVVNGFTDDHLEIAAQKVSGRVDEDSDLYDEDALTHSVITEFFEEIRDADNIKKNLSKFLKMDPDTNRVILQQMILSVEGSIERFVAKENYVPPEPSKYESVTILDDTGSKAFMPVLEELVRHYEARNMNTTTHTA